MVEAGATLTPRASGVVIGTEEIRKFLVIFDDI
jgi:hypothetical protein